MKLNLYKYSILLTALILSITLCSCSSTSKQDVDDKEIYELDFNSESVKESTLFAIQKAHNYNENLTLDFVTIRFDSIKDALEKKGIIDYRFYVENVQHNIDLQTHIKIDTATNSQILFQTMYGCSKKLGGLFIPVTLENWNIDINDVINVVKNTVDIDTLLSDDNDGLEITCRSNSWEVSIYSKSLPAQDIYLINISPETGKVENIQNNLGTKK